MWKDRRPGCVQLAGMMLFGVGVLVGLFYATTARNPNAPQMGIYKISREFHDDFTLDATRWLTENTVFRHDNEANTLRGVVPIGRGYATVSREPNLGDVTIEAALDKITAPDGAVVSAGILCRADEDGNGYYFLITSNGLASIRKGLAGEDDLRPIVDWTEAPTIQQSLEQNVIGASCVSDYLMLSVNGVFVADARDTSFSRGFVGVTIAGSNAGGNVTAAFDNITAWSAAARQ